jgi:hypothetical protein
MLVVLVSLTSGIGLAAIPHRINYQGRLVDSDTGEPLPGAHNMTFRIFDVASLGTHLWTEDQPVEADTTGVVSVILGSVTPIDITFDGRLWLEVEVDTEILEPRRELVSVPYAFHAMDSDSLGGLHSDSYSLVGHAHDDRYYTETELNASDGSDPNTGSNFVHWDILNGVPAGFVDGVDDEGAGDGHSLDADDGHPVNVVYVDADGQTGVGTNEAERLLHVYDGSAGSVTSVDAAELVIEDDGNARINMLTPNNKSAGIDFGDPGDASRGWLTYDHTADKMKLGTSNADRLTVASDGDVGIGTTTPAEKLHVAGNVRLNAGGDVEFGDTNTEIRESGDDLFVTADDDLFLSPDDDVFIRADGGTDWVRFDSGTERVGIGTTTPVADLDIEAGFWTDIVLLGADPTNKLRLGSGANWASLSGGASNTDDLVIRHSTGNIGIGTVNPGASLHVAGSMDEELNDHLALFKNAHSLGVGLQAVGGGAASQVWPAAGAGLAATGYEYGIYSRSDQLGNNMQASIWAAGGYGSVFINYRSSGGTHYKITGPGIVSTTMVTSAGEVRLAAPESPEPWIDDYGSGEIVDGTCHIDLDPIYLDCVTANEQHPLKVFIEFTSPLPHHYYISKGLTGFDLIVIGEGTETADATFDYRVVGKWKGHEDFRFETADPLPEMKTATLVEPVQMGDNE